MEAFLGQIMMFAGSFTPNGWLPCDGRAVEIKTNTALFSILGTTYGGDGVTFFHLPNLTSKTNQGIEAHLGYCICVAGIYPSRP